MSVLSELRPAPSRLSAITWRPSWHWVHVVVAALAMVATLPGRTHGLGLITEPLLADLRLDRLDFATINLWATLLGALFCVPCGWLLDRLGTRAILVGVTVSLGLVVLLMSRTRVDGLWELFVLVLLTRGLGQSALSVASLALIGKTAGRRPGPAVGVYSFVTAVGFMLAFGAVKYSIDRWDLGWRTLWADIGGALLVFAVLAGLLVRPALVEGSPSAEVEAGKPRPGQTLGQALRTPVFWVFALTTSLYGMIAAGVSLFNQSILAERGFDRGVFLTITTLSPLVGLGGNLATGWLAGRWSLGRLLAVAMLVLAAALLAFTFVETLVQVYLYAAAMGAAGGMITVLFFAVWGQTFGPTHLGRIQGAAQMLTVLASAIGPLLLAVCQRWTGSYLPLFQCAAAAAVLLAVAAWFVSVPAPADRASLEQGSCS